MRPGDKQLSFKVAITGATLSKVDTVALAGERELLVTEPEIDIDLEGASINVKVVSAPNATTTKKVIWLNADNAFCPRFDGFPIKGCSEK